VTLPEPLPHTQDPSLRLKSGFGQDDADALDRLKLGLDHRNSSLTLSPLRFGMISSR